MVCDIGLVFAEVGEVIQIKELAPPADRIGSQSEELDRDCSHTLKTILHSKCHVLSKCVITMPYDVIIIWKLVVLCGSWLECSECLPSDLCSH